MNMLEKGKEKEIDIDKNNEVGSSNNLVINNIQSISTQRWYIKINIVINNDYKLSLIALVDSGADLNCIQEGLVPVKYYEKSSQRLSGVTGDKLKIGYKLSNVHVCNDNYCYKTNLILVKNMGSQLILGQPFITQLYPFKVNEKGLTTKVLGKKILFPFAMPMITKEINIIDNKKKHIEYLVNEINDIRIENQLRDNIVKNKIRQLEEKFKNNVCATIPNAFWKRRQHIVSLPYIKEFNEKDIPTKSKSIHMSQELVQHCRKEIQDLLDKKLIRPSKSPWSCSAFYVMNSAEIERGAPRLVINYKPLNKVLKLI